MAAHVPAGKCHHLTTEVALSDNGNSLDHLYEEHRSETNVPPAGDLVHNSRLSDPYRCDITVFRSPRLNRFHHPRLQQKDRCIRRDSHKHLMRHRRISRKPQPMQESSPQRSEIGWRAGSSLPLPTSAFGPPFWTMTPVSPPESSGGHLRLMLENV